MLFDTHAHILDEQFDNDRQEVIDRINEQMGLIVNVGCNLEDCHRTVALAEQEKKIYAAVGLHPNDAYLYTDALWEEICTLARHPKVVGIGETGLDYYWDDSTPEQQKELFIKHIDLAKALNKPLVIHDREAHRDTMTILKEQHAEKIGGIFHAFSGSPEMAKIVLDMNFYIALGGPVTFKNARKTVEVAAMVPLDRLLIETDCPYMTPVPFRGKRNEPVLVRHTAEKIAEIRGISYEEVLQATWENAKRAYKISE